MTRVLALVAAALLLLAGSAAADYPRAVSGGVEFVYLDGDASQVYWAGDFNGWSTSANALVRDDGGAWRLTLPLAAGEHAYKFVVDGNWIVDPDNPNTGGEYGNSVIKVAADGSVEEPGGGRAPSQLNSKLFIGGLYYGNYELEAIEREGERVMLEKPTHDINLGFELKLSPSLTGEVELNVNNRAELSEMWRTDFNFQRARLVLTRPQFRLELFDNMNVFVSDDPLGLVGNVGTDRLPYGYGAQGAVFEKTLPQAIDFKLLLADSGDDNPWRPEDPVGDPEITVPYSHYTWNMGDGYRDDIVIQAGRDFGKARLIYLTKAARGLRPGALFHQTMNPADSSLTQVRYHTVQNNLLQAAVWRQDWLGWLSTDVEFVWGGAKVQARDRTYLMLDGDPSYTNTHRKTKNWDLQKTRGSAVVARLWDGKPFNLELRHRYQENRNLYSHIYDVIPDFDLSSVNAWARSYAANLSFERGGWRYRLDLEQEEFEFDLGLDWRDHFWFDQGFTGAGNLWITGNQLPLAKFGLVGYRSASVIRQSLEIPLVTGAPEGGDLSLRLSNQIASTRLDRDALYWDLESEWRWRPLPHWEILYNQRYAKYDHDFLGLNDFFVDQFAEVSYRVGASAVVSLGWGVDPYRLDPTTKTFLDNGRRLFLAEQGADEDAIQNNYLRMGSILENAEDALAKIQRITLEARVSF